MPIDSEYRRIKNHRNHHPPNKIQRQTFPNHIGDGDLTAAEHDGIWRGGEDRHQQDRGGGNASGFGQEGTQ